MVEHIIEAIYESESFEVLSFDDQNGFSLRLLHRSKDYYGLINSKKWIIAWYGLPIYNGKALDQNSFRQFEEYLSINKIYDWVRSITGHFQLVIYSHDLCSLNIFSDKTSTHPVFYTEISDYILITPEPLSLKTMRKFGFNPTIRTGAFFEFMASGHLWGDGTYWNETKRLGPGQFINCSSGGIKVESYWKMIYEPKSKNKNLLLSELFEAVQRDIDLLPTGRGILTLSGGYDSRGLLGLLKQSKAEFHAISYSFGEDFSHNSDAGVGKYFANKLNIPHRFYKACIDDPSRLIDDIRKSVIATGGQSDVVVAQDAFLGISFYKDLAKDYDYLLRGDEIWGWGDHVINLDMAFWQCLLFNLNEFPQPEKILKNDKYSLAVEYLNDKRKEYSAEYTEPAKDLDSVKDYLYWRHREARLLQNMAYFRRCYISHFAPFLFDNTISVIRTIPSKLRIRKRLFLEMMRKQFPDLFLDRNSPTPYISGFNRFDLIYQNEIFREFVVECLIKEPAESFKEVFEVDIFTKWVQSVLDNTNSEISNIQKAYNIKRFINNVLRRNQFLLAHIKSILARLNHIQFPVLNSVYLFRILVLSLALKEYESG
jgi:hypothetical protein